MWVPLEFLSKNSDIFTKEDYEDMPEHAELTERFRRTFYYGHDMPDTERPSLPLSEIAVEFFQDAAPRGLGRVDKFVAANVSRKACMSPCSLMLGMIYIERLKNRNPEYLQKVSSSDLFLISMMVASKYLYDEGVDEEVFNDEWSDAAKMDVEDLNELERNFLSAIDWHLFVSAIDFWKIVNSIEQRIAGTKARERGFFTYSDLSVLSDDPRIYEAFRKIMLEMCKVMMVCSVAYVAGAVTVVGSMASLVYLRHHLPHQTGTIVRHSVVNKMADMDLVLTPGADKETVPALVEDADITSRLVDLDGQSLLSHDELNNGTSHQDSQLNKPNARFHKPAIGRKLRSKTGTTNGEKIGKSGTDSGTKSTGHEKGDSSVGLLHLPSLMTLVMLKDTLVQFASAVKEKYATGPSWLVPGAEGRNTDDDNIDNDQDSELICTHGHCTQDQGQTCRNRTVVEYSQDCHARVGQGGWHHCHRPGIRAWQGRVDQALNPRLAGLPPGLDHRQYRDFQQGTCLGCQCCCRISKGASPWQLSMVSKVMKPLHDVIPGHRTTAVVAS